MKLLALLQSWWYPRDLSRVEVVKALFELPVIRPVKPNRNLILVRGARDVWDSAAAHQPTEVQGAKSIHKRQAATGRPHSRALCSSR